MPIIKSAIKKVRKDKKRTARNLKVKKNIKSLLKEARKSPSPDALGKLSSALDKAVKINFIHANKASRLKSRMAHHISAGVTSIVSKPKKAKAKKSPKRSK